MFEHFEVMRDALRHVQGKMRLPEIQVEVDRQLKDGRLETVNHVRPHAPAARYTTPELIQTEREAIERVRAGIAQVRPIANVTIRDIQSKYGRNLNEDQVQLVHQSLASRDQIFGIQGGAGTGKTTALRAIKEVAEEKGYKAIGLGPTSRAAKGLKEGGLHAETLQAFLTRGDQRIEDTRPRLVLRRRVEPCLRQADPRLSWPATVAGPRASDRRCSPAPIGRSGPHLR